MTDYKPLMKIPYFFASVADGASWSETYDFCEAQTDKFKDKIKIYNLLYDLGSEMLGEEAAYMDELQIHEGKKEVKRALHSKYTIRKIQLSNVKRLLTEKLNLIIEHSEDESTMTNPLETIIDSTPKLIPEVIPELFNILKDFFTPDQQAGLETLLKTGKCNNSPLLFNDNGNRLTDAFRKLKEKDFIICCGKKDLEKWIQLNFNYVSKKTITAYTPDYLEKCVSRKDFICKKPLFEIENSKIVRK